MGNVTGCSTLKRWSKEGGAGGTPNPAPPTLPSRREGGGGAQQKLTEGGVEQTAISPADARAGVARELRTLKALGRTGPDALRDAIEITAAKIRNASALVEHQVHAGKCHACGEPLDGIRPEVAIMQAKGGGHLWLHGGECHEVHRRRRAALVDDIMRTAGYGPAQTDGEAA